MASENLVRYDKFGLSIQIPECLRIISDSPRFDVESTEALDARIRVLINPPEDVRESWAMMVRGPVGANPVGWRIERDRAISNPYNGWERIQEEWRLGPIRFHWMLALIPERGSFIEVDIAGDGKFSAAEKLWTEVVRSIRVDRKTVPAW